MIVDEENEILDFLYFSDLDFLDLNISPKNLLDNLGFSECGIEILLNLLKIGGESAKTTFQNFNCEGNREEAIRDYHWIGSRFAPVALAIYDRLSKKNEEPRLPTYLAVNRFKSTDCFPDTVMFWADPDAIVCLYESLKKDGYYACA